MNVGEYSVRSTSGLLTSVAWSLGGTTTYALEGSVFNAGSSIQWLRDELGLIGSSRECDLLAESVPDNGGVYLVSAFTGLGAPHWDMYARGALFGLTRGATKAHICRAVLEGIAYQVADLLDTMRQDTGREITALKVDGGACVSDFMMQFQADLLGFPVNRPKLVETTAMGAAYLAGLAAGVWNNTQEIANNWNSQKVFHPQMTFEQKNALRNKWNRAVERTKKWEN